MFKELLELCQDKEYELRLHLNPYLDKEMNLMQWCGEECANARMSEDNAKFFISKGYVLTMLLFPIRDSDKHYYCYGTDLNKMSQTMLNDMEKDK